MSNLEKIDIHGIEAVLFPLRNITLDEVKELTFRIG